MINERMQALYLCVTNKLKNMKRILFLCLLLTGAGITRAQLNKPLIEEYTDIVEDGSEVYRDRYVLSYDRDGWRSSEIIYRSRQASFTTWEEEEMLNIGHYTYEFDTQGRVRIKTVIYENENERPVSYRIIADYGSSPTRYTRYERSWDGWEKVSAWTCHEDGTLAWLNIFDYYEIAYYFNAYGDMTGRVQNEMDGQYGWMRTGTVNDSTIHVLPGGSYLDSYDVHYRYDGQTGRLLECTDDDGYRRVYEYDALGRMTKYSVWTQDGDESDSVWPAGHDTRADEAEEWVLDFEEAYTYFSDEVYPVGNSWRDVFGMEGPWASVRGKDGEGHEGRILFNRDGDGRLLSVGYSGFAGQTVRYEVADGCITKISYLDEDEEPGAVSYTWKDGEVTDAVYENSYYSAHNRYTHGDGTMTRKSWEDDRTEYYTLTTVSQRGTLLDVRTDRYSAGELSEWGGGHMRREVQAEDVVVERPDVGADLDGFCYRTPLLVSAAGRVVCSSTGDSYDGFRGYGFTEGNYFSEALSSEGFYVNVCRDRHYSVAHSGSQTICYDAEGRRVFVLSGSRLLREYRYEAPDVASTPVIPDGGSGTRAVSEEEAVDVTEIVYEYNASGLLVGKTFNKTGSDGKTSQETYVYKYDTSDSDGMEDVTETRLPSVRKVLRDGRVRIVTPDGSYNTVGQRLK